MYTALAHASEKIIIRCFFTHLVDEQSVWVVDRTFTLFSNLWPSRSFWKFRKTERSRDCLVLMT